MKKNGFTMVEMLAVVVLIGLLAVIIVSKVKPAISDSKESVAYASATSLVTLLEEYYFEVKMSGSFSGCSYNFDEFLNSCVGFSYTGESPSGGVLNLSESGVVSGNIIFSNKYSYKVIENVVSEDK